MFLSTALLFKAACDVGSFLLLHDESVSMLDEIAFAGA